MIGTVIGNCGFRFGNALMLCEKVGHYSTYCFFPDSSKVLMIGDRMKSGICYDFIRGKIVNMLMRENQFASCGS